MPNRNAASVTGGTASRASFPTTSAVPQRTLAKTSAITGPVLAGMAGREACMAQDLS